MDQSLSSHVWHPPSQWNIGQHISTIVCKHVSYNNQIIRAIISIDKCNIATTHPKCLGVARWFHTAHMILVSTKQILKSLQNGMQTLLFHVCNAKTYNIMGSIIYCATLKHTWNGRDFDFQCINLSCSLIIIHSLIGCS